MACALSMVFVSHGRSKQRHDAVPGELVDRALEAMNAVCEDREEAVEDAVPFLGVYALGDVHRPLHVREEDRHLLALAFERASRGEDSLRQMRRRVSAQVTTRRLDGARE